MKARVKEQVGRFTSTLKDALECEDLDGTGYIPAKTLKSCFHAMDINLDDDLIDYMIYISGTAEKIGKTSHLMLEYSKISDFVESLVDNGAYNNKSEDILKDDNDVSDDYGNDFEEPKSEPKQKNDSYEDNEYAEESQPQNTNHQNMEGEGELDQEITDEEMIGLAENCLVRIAEELLNKKMTLRELFEGEIIAEDLEGEKIELLFPTSFLDGLEKLGIKDFSDLENA
jgi:flagellar motor switch/type III secretory pathway protein FliN